ncbi:PLP-dependent aminotransferase family protein [Pseudoroseicyclus aestuarii]|uniref:DNA-binding transcriptional MocR family regulator n=1 Tax=Pseudoroseicyclus aestuarii TaxID=1795041 RepID=A0A318SW42_9RHOB|nr:PLP-dependent aminotransferase family protein [Pseudoroseicyclus aestuarii]PYE86080.1 DNA-binding transcriptional MocR family regulator [Pseudoroseicyclus aestuarii]
MTDTIWFPDPDPRAATRHGGINAAIREAIAEGVLPVGHRLPPVREVAYRLGVTPGTVARAYRDLVEDGLLAAQVGRGTFVADPGEAEAGAGPSQEAPQEEPQDEPAPLLPDLRAGMLNLATAQVADVGQGAMLHRLMTSLPAPKPGDWIGYPQPAGDAALRAALADWLARPSYGRVGPDVLVPTMGAQHGLVVLFQMLLRGPHPVVATEELAYSGIRHAAGLTRAQVVGVPMDAEGPLPDALDRVLRDSGAQIFCTTAEAHNPTTVRTSPERRQAVAEIARRRAVQIVDDDCFGAGGMEAGYRVLAPDRSWIVTSVSKSLSPELRLGVVLTPEGRATDLRATVQRQIYGLPRPLTELGTAVLASGEAARVRRAVHATIAQRNAIVQRELGAYGVVTRDKVPFAWLPMPKGWRASTFVRAAEGQDIRLRAADEFALIGGLAPNAVRLSVTGEAQEARLVAGLSRLLALLEAAPPVLEA